MAMEVPIVSTDVDGVKEAVTDQKEALLVPAQDSVALAAGIDRMLNDKTLRERLARQARTTVETDFSFAHRTRTIENLYRKLMSA